MEPDSESKVETHVVGYVLLIYGAGLSAESIVGDDIVVVVNHHFSDS